MGQLADQLETQIARLMKLDSQRSESETASPAGIPPPPPLSFLVEVPEIARGRGWTVEKEQQYALRARRLLELQNAAGIPRSDLYRGFTWSAWKGDPRPDLLAWPRLVDEQEDRLPPWAVVVYGPPGTGKTHVATAVFTDLLCRGWAGKWFEVAEALEQVKDEMGDDERDGRTMKVLRESELLLLDDLGAERQSDFALERMSLVLRHRYSRQLLTIITTNHSSLTSLDEIDSRLSSRLGGREAIQVNFERQKDWRL